MAAPLFGIPATTAALPPVFLVFWIIAALRGGDAAKAGSVTLPRLVAGMYYVVAGLLALVGLLGLEGAQKLFVIVYAVPGVAVPWLSDAMRERGMVRSTYYVALLLDPRWGPDTRGGALFAAALAHRRHRREQDAAFLERRFAAARKAASPQDLLGRALISIRDEERGRLRAMFRLVLLFEPTRSASRARTMALEWLAVEALSRGAADEARRFASGRRPAFFSGRVRKIVRKVTLEELLEAPSRNPWDEIPGLPTIRLGSSALLRALSDAIGEKRRAWDLRRRRAPEVILRRARREVTAVKSAPTPRGTSRFDASPAAPDLSSALVECATTGAPLDPTGQFEAAQLLESWAIAQNASDEDVEWVEEQLELLAYPELVEDERGGAHGVEDESPERIVTRLETIGAGIQDEAAVLGWSEWDFFSRLIEMDRLFDALHRAHPDHLLDVWDELNSATVSCGADLWNERQAHALGHLFIAWAGMQAFVMRDAKALQHTIGNFSVMA